MDDRAPVNLRCSVLLLRDDNVLLCRRTQEDNLWVLPGGTPRPGEGSATAAAREVAEEAGLQVTVERVAFVLETTSWDASHHLIEIVFLAAEGFPRGEPIASEAGLDPGFVALDDLPRLELRPPIAGYMRGYARSIGRGSDPHKATAPYLGNVWRADRASRGAEN